MTTAPELIVAPTARAAFTPPRLSLLPAPADPGEFDAALERARPRLLRYALRRLADHHEAEEVVQEALLRGHQHRSTFASEDDLMAWLTVVTGRLAIDRLRVRGRSVAVPELPPASRTMRDTADVVVARAEARIALDAIEAMPTRQAAVLWAREVEGLAYDEIAARYRLSEPTVRSLLHRARRTLRREYSARGGTVPVGGVVALAPAWLGGLRALGRLRGLGRRVATGCAAATGIALVGVLAIGSSPVEGSPARPASPDALAHVPVTQAHSITLTAARVATTGHQPPVEPVTTTDTAPAPAPGARPLPLPVKPVCAATVTVGCSAHTTPTLYLRPALPANPTGWTQAGVASDLIDCAVVPDTPLTTCEAGSAATGGQQ